MLIISGNGCLTHVTANGTSCWLTYDAEARTTRWDMGGSAPGQGSSFSTFGYDGAGLRVFRHDAQGRDFPLAYDGASPGSALLSSAGTSFTPGLAQQDSNGQHFYQVDALGSVRGVSGNDQSPQGEVYYDAFGLPSLRQGQMPGPLGFAGAAGYQTDADTGLMLLGNRYYDASIGRFLSPDKVHDGDNWYAYCGNDPLGATDPTGLTPLTAPNGASFGNPGGGTFNAILADNGFDNPSFFDENIQMAAKSSAAKEAKAAATNILTGLDKFFTFGSGGKLVTTFNAYRQGKASGWSLIGSAALFAGSVAVNFIPGEEEANLAARGVGGVITGFTRHGINSAIYHDGVGVAGKAILDAVKNPIRTISQSGGSTRYIGANAVVVVNKFGKVITTWATNSGGVRFVP